MVGDVRVPPGRGGRGTKFRPGRGRQDRSEFLVTPTAALSIAGGVVEHWDLSVQKEPELVMSFGRIARCWRGTTAVLSRSLEGCNVSQGPDPAISAVVVVSEELSAPNLAPSVS